MAINTEFQTAVNAREDESKLLLTVDHIPEMTDRLFDYFLQMGCEAYANRPSQLLTRQLDTNDHDLLAHGITLRIRGDLQADGRIAAADICIKVLAEEDAPSPFMRRAEYEAPLTDFCEFDLTPLKKKYPPHTNPEFQDVLHMVERANLEEQFRILTTRPRLVIQIPNGHIDLHPDKKACIELQADNSSFGVDDPDRAGHGKLMRFASDTEVEYEILTKACIYDASPRKHEFVSKGLTDYDREKVFHFVNDHLEHHVFPRGTLIPHTDSKAERGFRYQKQLHEEIMVAHVATAMRVACSFTWLKNHEQPSLLEV